MIAPDYRYLSSANTEITKKARSTTVKLSVMAYPQILAGLPARTMNFSYRPPVKRKKGLNTDTEPAINYCR
jgi:hypothetical protein